MSTIFNLSKQNFCILPCCGSLKHLYGEMRFTSFLIWLLICFSFIGTDAQNAPITIAPKNTVCSAGSQDVSITVQGFNAIGAVSLTLEYNASSLLYQSFTNNSGFPGLNVFQPNPGVITAAGFSTDNGVTLVDNSVLFTLHFIFSGDSTGLNWFDDGPSCEYAGAPPTYAVLNDLPQTDYFSDGSCCMLSLPPDAETIIGPEGGNVCRGEEGVVFGVPLISNATDYIWSLPAGAVLTAGANTNVITVSFFENAMDGMVTVHGSNACGVGGNSPDFPVFINTAPEITGQPITPDTVIAGAGIATFSVIASGSVLTYQWQEFITAWADIANGGVYSGALSETLTIANPPLSMSGNKYRCIVDGFCEPADTTNGQAILNVDDYTGYGLSGKNKTNVGKLIISVSTANTGGGIVFRYQLPLSGHVQLDIFGIDGHYLGKLLMDDKPAGNHLLHLTKNEFPTGIYIARILLNKNTQTLKGTVKFFY